MTTYTAMQYQVLHPEQNSISPRLTDAFFHQLTVINAAYKKCAHTSLTFQIALYFLACSIKIELKWLFQILQTSIWLVVRRCSIFFFEVSYVLFITPFHPCTNSVTLYTPPPGSFTKVRELAFQVLKFLNVWGKSRAVRLDPFPKRLIEIFVDHLV